jgi:hypothetical protein
MLHLFDEDNVLISKGVPNMEGEVSGKKGDAFRLILLVDTNTLGMTRKIEARSSAPPGK